MVKRNNYLDKIKKSKYSLLTKEEEKKQRKFFQCWVIDMLNRKQRGDEKYGNYMLSVDDSTSFEELREEMLDCCNHLVMLTYKLRGKLVK